jgi:hypothetical protein
MGWDYPQFLHDAEVIRSAGVAGVLITGVSLTTLAVRCSRQVLRPVVISGVVLVLAGGTLSGVMSRIGFSLSTQPCIGCGLAILIVLPIGLLMTAIGLLCLAWAGRSARTGRSQTSIEPRDGHVGAAERGHGDERTQDGPGGDRPQNGDGEAQPAAGADGGDRQAPP